MPTKKSRPANFVPSLMLSKRWRAYGFLFINLICWSAAFIVVKPSLEFTTPFRFLFYRFLVASLLAIPILLYYWPKVKNPWRAVATVLPIELVANLGLSLLYSGLALTGAIETSLIINTLPIFITLAGIFFLQEKQEGHEWAGLTVSVAGTALLILLPLLTNQSYLGQFSVLGTTLLVTQNCTSTLYYILAKKYYINLPKLFVTSLSFYLGAVSFGILSWGQLNFNTSALVTTVIQDLAHPEVWVATLYMAVFGSLIGLAAYLKAQELVEVSEASLFGYLHPLIYLPLGVIFLGETLTAWQLVAMGLVLFGVALSEFRFKKRFAWR